MRGARTTSGARKAATHFTRAMSACGPSAPLLLALGQAQLLARRPADAVTTLDRIWLTPGLRPGPEGEGQSAFLLRRDSEAEETLKRAAGRAPADPEVP